MQKEELVAKEPVSNSNKTLVIVLIIIAALLILFLIIGYLVYYFVGPPEPVINDTEDNITDIPVTDSDNETGHSTNQTTNESDGDNGHTNGGNGGCTPNCAGKECGGDGCAGSCGTCESGQDCVNGICKQGGGPVCGNSHIEGEECDDGNLNNGDGCNSTCKIEPGWNCTGDPSVCQRICENDPGCTAEGLYCDSNVPYNCTLGDLGCYNRDNLTACSSNEQCISGECHLIPNCTHDDNCTSLNLPEISACTNNPDGNPLTYDFAPENISTCNLALETCTSTSYTYTHSCNSSCGAECSSNTDCSPTHCDYLDGCVGADYHDYNDVQSSCISCDCQGTCNDFTIYSNDPRCDSEILVSDCMVITTPGDYYMNADIVQDEDVSCIELRADDITFDCKGYSISTTSGAKIAGIASLNQNSKIYNCNITKIPRGYGVYFGSSNNSIVSGGTFTLNNISINMHNSHGVEISGNKINDNENYGIHIGKGNINTSVINNEIKFNGFAGIWINDSTQDTEIRGNTIVSGESPDICIHVTGFSVSIIQNNLNSTDGNAINVEPEADSPLIESNEFYAGTVFVRQSNNARVNNNNFYSCGINGHCISLFQTSSASVRNNQISGSGGLQVGISLLMTSSNNLVQGNIISNVNQGIFISGDNRAKITDNDISSCTSDAIYVTGDSQNMNISGNQVSNNPRGINVMDSQNIVVEANTLNSNTGEGIYVHQGVGHLGQVYGIILDSNTINSGNYGIRLEDANSSIIKNNVLSNQNTGIYCRSSLNTFTNNVITDHTQGILFGAESTGNQLLNNEVCSNSLTGHDISCYQAQTLSGNTCREISLECGKGCDNDCDLPSISFMGWIKNLFKGLFG